MINQTTLNNTGLTTRPNAATTNDQLTLTKVGYYKSMPGWMNTKILVHPEDLKNAVLIVHGEKAHSRYMGEDTFKKLKGDNKELVIVPNATHTDLYDGGDHDYIPFDKIDNFFKKNL